jgi:hypothetical protein
MFEVLLAASAARMDKVADLVGHHRETCPSLTGSGRFNRRVQGQQVGLESDLINGLDDFCGFDRCSCL